MKHLDAVRLRICVESLEKPKRSTAEQFAEWHKQQILNKQKHGGYIMTTRKDAMAAVNKACREAQAAFNRYSEESWNSKVKSMEPGAMMPPKRRFYDAKNRQAYNTELNRLRNQVSQVVADYESSLNIDLAEAPSEEALRAVEAFKLLDPKSVLKSDYERRLNAVNEKYGDNVMVSEALRSIGRSAGIQLQNHPVTQAYEDVESLKRSANSFFSKHYVIDGSDGAGSEITNAEIDFMCWAAGYEPKQ